MNLESMPDLYLQLPFFLKLTPKEQQRLFRYLYMLDMPAGHAPYQQGSIAVSGYLLLKGSVELVRDKENRPADRLRLVLPGQFFGLALFLDQDGRHAETALTCEPCQTVALVRQEYQALQKHNPQLAIKVLQQVQSELYQEWIKAREEYHALSDRLTQARILI